MKRNGGGWKKNARDKQPTDFCVCQVKIAKLLEMGIFFPLGRTFRELAKCYFLPSELYQTLGDARTMPYTIL